ncbi:MAG: hypothetical protein PQJ59_05310, partial [Spirochaetales bacterium]|nr:hypothetical protein [Spirochaetales bacterium]
MRKAGFPNILIYIVLLFLSSLLFGQSRMPADTDAWLMVTENPSSGGLDAVVTIFFEVPDTVTSPIYFGIRDPECNDDRDPDSIIATTGDGTDDGLASLTEFRLFMGDDAYTGANARDVDYGIPASNHDTDGTCPSGYDYRYDETTTAVSGYDGTDVTDDKEWVYFPSVYASEGEQVGNNYYFRLVVEADPDDDINTNMKNAFQVIASYNSDSSSPTEITAIRAFSYSWCVDFEDDTTKTWDFYPFVPDSSGSTESMDLNFIDMDNEGSYSLDSYSGNISDSDNPGNTSPWSSYTNGGHTTDYQFGTDVNETWQVSITETTNGTNDGHNGVEFYAENEDTGDILKIYSSEYIPDQPYRIMATIDESDTDDERTVNLQIVDDEDNSVPYERTFDMSISYDGGGSYTLSPTDTSDITTNAEGFYSFTCTDATTETVTISFITDGTGTTDTLEGVNDTVTLVFDSGSIPTLSTDGSPDLRSLTEGDSPTDIDFTIVDVDGDITTTNGIYLRIPDTVSAEFDTTVDLSGNITGDASGNVSSLVSYYDSTTIFIDVTTDFSSGDTIVLSGAAFTSTNSASSGDFELSYSGVDGPYNVVDDYDNGGADTDGDDIVIASSGSYTYYVWDGSEGSTFSDVDNWQGGVAPTDDGLAKVTIADSGTDPVIPAYTTGFYDLTIDSGANPTLEGDLIVLNSYSNSGTLTITDTSDTSITFSGSAFDSTPSLGDVEFTGTSGEINYTYFDSFTLTSGTWDFTVNSDISFDENVTLASGATLNLDYDQSFYVYGSWTNNGTTIWDSTGTDDGASLNLSGTQTATISGDSTLLYLICTEPGKTVVFETGSTQTVDYITLKGDSTDDLILEGTGNWTIDYSGGGTDISYVTVDYGNADTTDIYCDYSTINNITSNQAGTGFSWFDSTVSTVTWDGDQNDGDVYNGDNWDTGTAPTAGDTIIIADASTYTSPILSAAWDMTGSDITIESGGTLDLDDQTLTCANFENNGTLRLQSTGDVAASTSYTDSGSIVYHTTGTTGLPLGDSYTNLTIEGGSWVLDSALSVTSEFSLEGGSLNSSGSSITVYGDMVLSGGTLTMNGDLTGYGDFNIGSSASISGSSGDLSISGEATLGGDITYTNAAIMTFSGGLSSSYITGAISSVGGTIDVSGSSASSFVFDGGSFDAGSSGTITIDSNSQDIYCASDDANVELTADTITLSNTGTVIGSGTTNSLDTASANTCAMTLPGGNVAIYIDHTGAVAPSFTGYGGDRTPPLTNYGLSIVATGDMTLPAYTLESGTEVMEFEAANLTVPADCEITTTDGNISLTGTSSVTFDTVSSADITASGSGSITVTSGSSLTLNKAISVSSGDISLDVEYGSLTVGQAVSSTSGNITLDGNSADDNTAYVYSGDISIDGAVTASGNVTFTAYNGSVSQSGVITANTLTVTTYDDDGGDIDLNDATNDCTTIDLQAWDDDGSAYGTGTIYFAENDGFVISNIFTASDVSLSVVNGQDYDTDSTVEVTQSGSGGGIKADELVLGGTGDYFLNDTTDNTVGYLAGSVTGDLYFSQATQNIEVGYADSLGVTGLVVSQEIGFHTNYRTFSLYDDSTNFGYISCRGLMLRGWNGHYLFSSNSTNNSVSTLEIYSSDASNTVDEVSLAQNVGLTLGDVDTCANSGDSGITLGEAITLDLGTNDLTIEDSSTSIDVDGALTITAGQIINGDNVDFYSSGNVTLSLDSPTTLGNTWIFDADSDGTGSTDFSTSFTGTGSLTFNNIQIGTETGDAAASVTLTLDSGSSWDVDGDITVGSMETTTFDISDVSLNIAGDVDFTNLDTFTSTGSTVTFDSSTAVQDLTSAGLSFNNIIINGGALYGVAASDSTVTTGTINVTSGTFSSSTSITSGGQLTVDGGTLTANGSVNVTSGGMSVTSGTATTNDTLTITTGDLSVSGTGSMGGSGDIDLNDGGISLAGTGTFDCVTRNIYLTGDWTENIGTLDVTDDSSLITFDGSGTSTINGVNSIDNLTVASTATLNIDTSSLICNNNLIVNGVLDSNSIDLTVAGTVSGSGTLQTSGTETLDIEGNISVNRITIPNTSSSNIEAASSFSPSIFDDDGAGGDVESGTVTLDGANTGALSGLSFYNLNIGKDSNTDVITSTGALTVTNSLGLSGGNWTLGAYTHSISNGWDSSSVTAPNYTMTTTDSTIQLNSGNVEHEAGEGFNNFTVNGAIIQDSGLEVGSNLVINNTYSLTTSDNNLTVGGAVSGSGTLTDTSTATAETIDIGGDISGIDMDFSSGN